MSTDTEIKGTLTPETRIELLKKQLHEYRLPRVSIENALLMTESYKQTEGEPMTVRRAKALNYIFSNRSIGIADNELIVGDIAGGKPGDIGSRSAPVRIEYTCDLFDKNLDGQTKKEVSGINITDEDKAALLEIIPYWRGRSHREKVFLMMPDDLREQYKQCVDISRVGVVGRGYGQTTVDYARVVAEGLDAVTAEAEAHLKKLDPSDPAQLDKIHFHRSVIITHQGVIKFAHRYADLARELAAKEPDGRRKTELETIADICKRVPAGPARSFYEALQSIWFIQMALWTESTGPGLALGRMDQYLFPIYRKDVEIGRLDTEKAKELLKCFYVKLNSFGNMGGADLLERGVWVAHQNLAVGGLGRNGKDATNELSYLIIEADGELGMMQPDTVVRIDKDTPRDFTIKACEIVKKCGGKFKFVGDNATVGKLLGCGFSLEEARDYTVTGCMHPSSQGISACASTGHMNLLHMLELALNNGVGILTGKQYGPKTGDPSEFKSLDDVIKAFKTQLAYFVDLTKKADCAALQAQYEVVPCPFQSSLIGGCLDKGTDLTNDGAAHNLAFFCGHAITNVSDSITAIKKCVFEDRKITMAELVDALRANFEGKEDIQKLLLEAPKFGNDDGYADSIMREIVSIFADEVQKPGFYGGRKIPGAQLVGVSPVIMGSRVGASADGRKARDSINDGGVSPVVGKNVRGPAATYNSVGKLDQVKLKAGSALNLSFSSDAMKDYRSTQKFAALLETYLNDLGGFHVQFNVVSKSTLLDAQKHPEKHKDLLVRVSTFGAYFVELSKEIQDQIISRTENVI